jgi:hypothetical protein
VEILLGTQGLEPRPYLLTAVEHLERLGHEVWVFAEEGTAPELRVVGAEKLPLAPDVIYAQDTYAALLLAGLYPLTPQVFAAHGDREDPWLPPQLAGVVARVVVFDDRTAGRARAAALPQELVRLRRPVDLERFSPRGALAERPRRGSLRLDGLSDYRRGLVERAFAAVGIDTGEADPDLVVGLRDDILEAMAAGRAAYVYGDDGGDGWVTPERYELLEADGFTGTAEPHATDFERLRRDLEGYDAGMGPANRELAQAHDAREHAQELVALFEQLAPRRDPVDAPLRELARLVRVEAATGRRADAAAAEAAEAHARARELEQELAAAQQRVEELDAQVAELDRLRQEAPASPEKSRVRGLLGRAGQ